MKTTNLSKAIAQLVLKAAIKANGEASEWGMHQSKEPACLKKLIKK